MISLSRMERAMEMQEGLKALEQLLDPYDWFYEVCAEARRYVVYVHRMEKEQDAIIPDRMMGHQVVVHFASSRMMEPGAYLVKSESPTALKLHMSKSHMMELEGAARRADADGTADLMSLAEVEQSLLDDSDTPDTSLLTRELDRLEKQCGSNILQDIFYEIHDGKNAVTNLGAKYPEVRESLMDLYRAYGFDVIYNEMDG
ncbi:unnamed protein product [Sphagnum balticum]